MRIAFAISSLGALGLVLAAVGCSAGGEDTDDAAGAVTPGGPAFDTQFELAQHCDSIVREKEGVRDNDLATGNVRWMCSDVAGVTFRPCATKDGAIDESKVVRQSDGRIKDKATGKFCDDPRRRTDFGQEYCEYHAVVNGQIVDKENRPPNGTVECVFTSGHRDADPVNGFNVRKHSDALQSRLELSSAPDPALVQMQVGFNSRGAADQLIKDCQEAGASMSDADWKTAERQVACVRAAKVAEDAGPIEAACKTDLSKDANWRKALAAGVKELAETTEPEFKSQDATADVVACTAAYKLSESGAIVSWRNSDPMICQRVLRAARECGDSFAPLPRNYPGFAMTNWEDPVKAPAGCEPLGGGQNLLVCRPSPNEVTKAKTAGKSMQAMCNEQFGSKIAMAAPVAVVAKKGSKSSPFCQAFHKSTP